MVLAIVLAPLVPCADDWRAAGRVTTCTECRSQAENGSMANSSTPVGDHTPVGGHSCVCVCHFPIVVSQSVALGDAPLPGVAGGYEGCRSPDGLPRAIFQPPRSLC